MPRKTDVGGASGPTLKDNKSSGIGPKSSDLVPPPPQGELFKVEKQAEINGVEMGVLESGVPFLTESGLSRMCGIDRKVLNRLSINWEQERNRPRGKKIDDLLKLSGYNETRLFFPSDNSGALINAYSEPVCLALLEYYAFVSDEPRDQAVNAFRTLARTTFRSFIYTAVGYRPNQRAIDSWKHFHDRIDMTMDAVPPGYFSVFREIASMIVPMIRSNIVISDKVVPDISVGQAWSKFWKGNGLDQYGERIQYDHAYPLYYPQAKSNPQPAFAYPDEILGIFRSWLRREYIVSKLPAYLTRQTGRGALSREVATKVIESLSPSLIEQPDRPEVRVKPRTHQPSKAELNEPIHLPGRSPELVARTVMQGGTPRREPEKTES